MTKLKEELAAPLRVMQEIARRIAKVSRESKLPLVEEEYVQSFKVELMDAVVQWCRGASFSDICKVCTGTPFIRLTLNYLIRELTLSSTYSSPTNSKAVSSASSAGYKNSFARCAQRPKSLETPSSSKSSQRRRRCSRGQIRSFSARLCICRTSWVVAFLVFMICFSVAAIALFGYLNFFSPALQASLLQAIGRWNLF